MKDYPWPVAVTLIRSTLARITSIWVIAVDQSNREVSDDDETFVAAPVSVLGISPVAPGGSQPV